MAMPKRKRAAPHPALQGEGVSAVSLAVQRHLRWLARPLPQDDWGIDMQLETVDGSRATVRLIGVQVKAGPSYFSEPVAEGWVFRDDSHLEYWTGYTLPVIVVLYDASTGTCYWQAVRPSTITSTGKGWKMTVPRSQVIDKDSEAALRELAGTGDPYVSRLAILRADLDLINAAAEGQRILVEVEEWVNKTSGRGSVRILVEGTAGAKVMRSLDFIAPGWSYEELLPSVLPWADLSLDDEAYDEHDRAQWDLETGAWDSEEGRYMLHSVDFEQWAADIPSGLRPYADNGEVAFWRLEARLGKVGEAFLDLDPFLSTGTVGLDDG
jgi:Domain of unknown function (DUF4365)